MSKDIIGIGTITLADINDASISTTPPTNPETGDIWIDSSGTKNVLKQWNGSSWIPAKLDVTALDDDLAEFTREVEHRLGTIAVDGELDHQDRILLTDELNRIIGETLSTSLSIKYPNALPDYNIVDANASGSFSTYRFNAREVGIETNTSVYVGLQNAYTRMINFLAGFNPKPWDIRKSQAKNLTDIGTGDEFREVLLEYFIAELQLVTATDKKAREMMDSDTYTVKTGETPFIVTPTQEGGAVYPEIEGMYGRNLLPAFTNDRWNKSASSFLSYSDYKATMAPGANTSLGIVVDVETNTDYTMVFNSDYARYYIYEWLDGARGNYLRTITEGSDVFTFNSDNLTQIEIRIDTWSQRLDRERNVWKLQLEKGTEVTPWSPAPEDGIKENSFDIISTDIGTLEGVDSKDYGKVGGRNYLRNSKERTLNPRNAGIAYDNYNYEILNYPTVDGQTYAISADVEITAGAPSGITVIVNYGNTGSSGLAVPIEDGKITTTYVAHDTMDSNTILMYAGASGATRGNGVIFRNIKIEQGNKATDWTEAPEDIPYDTLTSGVYKTKITLKEPIHIDGDNKDRLYRNDNGIWQIARINGETETLSKSNQKKLSRIPSFNKNTHLSFEDEANGILNTTTTVTAVSSSYHRQQQNKDYTDSSSSNSGAALDPEGGPYDIPTFNITELPTYTMEALVYWKGGDESGILSADNQRRFLKINQDTNPEEDTQPNGVVWMRPASNYLITSKYNSVTDSDAIYVKRNTWTRISVTYNGSETHIYLNGQLVASNSGGESLNLEGLRIGASNTGEIFNGYISDIRIWSRSLSDAELEDYYSKQLTGEEDGLILNYRLNGGNLIYDSGPYDNHIETDSNIGWVEDSTALRDLQQQTEDVINDKVDEKADELESTWKADIINEGDLIRQEVSHIQTDLEDEIVSVQQSFAELDIGSFTIGRVSGGGQTLDGALEAIRGEADDTGEYLDLLDSYFNFDLENEAFSIGVPGQETEMILTSSELGFYNGGVKVAHISNQQMQINQGIFVKSLTVGEHKIETLTDGITVFSWVGS